MLSFKHIVCCFLCVAFTSLCFGQYDMNGAEPTRTTWRQIKTDNFQVIYPKGFDSVANEFTKKLEFVYASCSKSLRTEPKKISVILHNQTNISNAGVAWCPSRMDIYTIPSEHQHSQEWYEHLAIHEFRHVVQMNSLNQGLTKILYFLLGEQAAGAVAGVYIPMWLMEGDAVCTETALSTSGRGRQANFSMGLRAQTYDKGVYSYSKAYFGSYRDYVPNYYEMGYFLLANTRKQYGQFMEAEILEQAAKYPLSIRPVNRAVLNKTNLPRRYLYTSLFEVQANEWKLKHDREVQTKYDTIAYSNYIYTSYTNGFQLNDSVYFAERSALNRIPQLVKIANGKEKVIANVSFKPNEGSIHSNGKTIVWEETNYHIRWEQRQTSRIYMYDIERHRKKSIRTRDHVFSPAISPSDNRIAVTKDDEDGKYYLVIYDKATKKPIKQVLSPDHDAILQPSWDKNGSKIVMLGLNSKGKRIIEYDVAENSFSEIMPYTTEDLTSPLYWNEYVIYTSSYSGVDNVFAVHRDTKQISRITVGDFGCRFPSVTDSTLIYSNYTSNGYQLAKIHLNPARWHDLNVVRKENYNLAQMMTNQEGGPLDFSTMPDTTYTSKYYSKVLHAVNIHSWMPLYMNYNGEYVDDFGNGFQMLSQNKLGTTISSAGYKWNNMAGTHNFFTKVTYKGLFPVFDFEADYGTLSTIDTLEITKNQFEIVDLQYRTKVASGRVYFPLNFSSKGYKRSAIYLLQYQKSWYDRISCPEHLKNNYKEAFSVNLLSHQLILTNTRLKAKQDLYPRWGQQLNIGINNSLGPITMTNTGFATNYFAELSLYIPGFQLGHGIYLYTGLEANNALDEIKKQNGFNYLPLNVKPPRGYIDTLAFPSMEYMCSFKFNYAFPMFYPDWEWGDFLYLKRICCNAFADYAYVEGHKNYASFGAEITADFHLCNFIAPITSGVRLSKLSEPKISVMEFIFTSNFNNL